MEKKNNQVGTIAAIPPDDDDKKPPPATATAAPAAGLFDDVASSGLFDDAPDTPVTTGSFSSPNNSPPAPPDTSNDAALAASLAASEEQGPSLPFIGGNTPNNNTTPNNTNYRVATAASSPWQYDDLNPQCFGCGEHFHALNRRHHCRLCGNVFCDTCTKQKALIPPSRIVLHPTAGKKAKPQDHHSPENISFSPDPDPDRMLTYLATTPNPDSNNPNNNANANAIPSATNNPNMMSTSSSMPSGTTPGGTTSASEQLLYGKGLEERFQLAREPIRVCQTCHNQLQPLQEELRRHNSNSVRFNYIDPTDFRRMFNSPLAFTLGHEIRKAAYTLNNLLPQPKRRSGALLQSTSSSSTMQNEIQQCKENCSTMSPNLGDLDGVKIPASLLEKAKGVAVMTVVKGGFGIAGLEFGTGLVVARLRQQNAQQQNNNQNSSDNNNNSGSTTWSAPSAIGTAGIAWGALIGAQVSDHVFLLMTDAAVHLMFSNKANFQLGADVGVAVGPLGRALEGDWGVGVGPGTSPAPIYTYSLSKGLYAGISLDGKIMTTREDVNEKFYGFPVTAQEILAGAVPTPPAAQPLYEALQRCHVYASAAAASANNANRTTATTTGTAGGSNPYNRQPSAQESTALMNEYGEFVGGGADHMSDITGPTFG